MRRAQDVPNRKNKAAGDGESRFVPILAIIFDQSWSTIDKISGAVDATNRENEIKRPKPERIRVVLTRISAKRMYYLNKFTFKRFLNRSRSAPADSIRLEPYFMLKKRCSFDEHSEVREMPLQIKARDRLARPAIRLEFALDAN